MYVEYSEYMCLRGTLGYLLLIDPWLMESSVEDLIAAYSEYMCLRDTV